MPSPRWGQITYDLLVPKGRSPLARAAIATLALIIFAWRKDYVIKRSARLENRYVRSRQWNCFIFLLVNYAEALLEEERSQRAQVETSFK